MAILAALAFASLAGAAPGPDILRLTPAPEGASPATFKSDYVYTWKDGSELVYALTGNVIIQQERLQIKAGRAVVWVDAEAVRKRRPTHLTVFADAVVGQKVIVDPTGSDPRELDKALLEFPTSRIGRYSGEISSKSIADSGQYRAALAARGRPVPPPKDPPPSPSDPARGPTKPAQFVPGNPDAPDIAPPVQGATVIPVPVSETRAVWIVPRTTQPVNITPITTGKERAFAITGGFKMVITFATGSIKTLEVQADMAVIWKRDGDTGQAIDAMRTEQGATDATGLELYLSGNVVMRFALPATKGPLGAQMDYRTVRAKRVYYDVDNHKAIAQDADLEYARENFVNTGHIVAREMHQLSATEFTAFEVMLHASRLPSDPGFVVAMDRADIYKEPERIRRTIFGVPFRDRKTGEIVKEEPEILEVEDLSLRVRDVPFFFLPYYRTNLNDPVGPFQGITFRQDRIFGFQTYATWDMLKLIGLTPLDNERWTLLTDYLTARGPGIGSNYSRSSLTFFGLDAPWTTQVKAYGIYDQGQDQLGGPRELNSPPNPLRGRLWWQHQQTFTIDQPDDLTVQAQLALLSDRNFLEQYYDTEYHYGPNQETFAWIKYQNGNAAGTLLAEPYAGRGWVTETHWLPKVEGQLIGQSLFERLTYHTWGSVAYAQMDAFRNPPEQFPLKFDNGLPPPEHGVETGRLDWMQVLSAPFDLGPARVVPYGVTDVAFFTQDNNGSASGRLYGGAGVRASVPLSRLYPDVQSELFDVKGLYHKNVFSVNYYIAGTTLSWAELPQLDRLNDDATESAWRDITPWQSSYSYLNPANGLMLGLGSYNIYNPRQYALRRLVDFNPENLGSIQEVQLDWRQRWQTKRGYPGLEHTVDWFTLDMSASIFPVPNRDNFGSYVGFLEYAAQWNAGDRTALYSNAWVDPFNFGARYWDVGVSFSRDDRTSFAVTYKNTDPLSSRLVAASATYVFSPKYAMTVMSAYDFGTSSSLTNSLYFTRVGTDLMITVGFTYNNIIKNFGFTLNIIPNLMGSQVSPIVSGERIGGPGLGGPGGGAMSGR